MARPRFDPMTVGQILDQALRLYRENFLRYVAIAAIVEVPAGLLTVVGIGIMYSNFPLMARPGGHPADPTDVLASAGTTLVGMAGILAGGFLSLVSMVLAMAAMARSMSASYLGGDLPAAQAYRSLVPTAGWLALAVLLVMPSIFALYVVFLVAIVAIMLVVLAVGAAGLGLVAMIIVVTVVSAVALAVIGALALGWGVMFALSVQTVALEGANTIEAIRRSAQRVRGNLRRSLGVALLTLVIVGIPGALVGGIGALGGIYIFGPTNMMAVQVIQQALSLFVQVLVTPVWGAAMLLLYYDLRIRKEGFDLEMLAQSFRPMEAAHAAAR